MDYPVYTGTTERISDKLLLELYHGSGLSCVIPVHNNVATCPSKKRNICWKCAGYTGNKEWVLRSIKKKSIEACRN